MKNNKPKQTKTKIVKNKPNEELVSALIKYLSLALVGAVILTIIFNLFLLPIFDYNPWLTMLLIIIPNILVFISLSYLFRKKLSYLKTVQKGSERVAEESFEAYIPLRGNNELTDIANNVNLIHDLYEAKNKAEALAKMENHHIITSISNKIHAPLTGIVGYLERIQNPDDHDFAKKEAYLKTALHKTYQVINFIDDLFEHAFTDNGKGYYQFKVYNGKPLIHQLLDSCSKAIEEAGFDVVLENCIERDFTLWVDLEQLQRIFDYLISNIIKYADPAKPVDFGLILNKNELCIILRNKTISNSDSSGKTVIDAEGSSLDSCRKIITRHQGRIDYYQLNQLFKVELILPIHQ
ncbi:MAG: HAMP domain-containing histidine kinase [Acetobacterium woodii]|nr:HAMP domain-containing histidine kinase [Acetobacterium woodii]